jgi:hypothetical protein
MTAPVAIEPGCHFDHGTAIHFEQDKRRCVLTDTLYGLCDDEALSYTIQAWAKLQPRLAKSRREPGQLYFPAACTHVFQKYWDYLNDPVQHPDCCETEFTKDAIHEMASALSIDSEAPDKSCRIDFLAATSRKCPIRDATDYWSQGVAVTGSGGPAPGQDSHKIDT